MTGTPFLVRNRFLVLAGVAVSLALLCGCSAYRVVSHWEPENETTVAEEVQCPEGVPNVTEDVVISMEEVRSLFPTLQMSFKQRETVTTFACEQVSMVPIEREVRERFKRPSRFNVILHAGLSGSAAIAGGIIGVKAYEDEDRPVACAYFGISALALWYGWHWMDNWRTGRYERKDAEWRGEARQGEKRPTSVNLTANPVHVETRAFHAAKFVPAEISSSDFALSAWGDFGNYISGQTDSLGMATLNIITVPRNWVHTVSRSSIEATLTNFPLLTEIRGEAREYVLTRILENFHTRDCTVTVRIGGNSTEVIVPGYEASDEAIFGASAEFVRDIVNPNIDVVVFTLKDYDTHVPVEKAKAHVTPSVESPDGLLSKYFVGSSMVRARDYLEPYVYFEYERQSNTAGQIEFGVLRGGAYDIQFTHPIYHYDDKRYEFADGNLSPIIEMRKVGH